MHQKEMISRDVGVFFLCRRRLAVAQVRGNNLLQKESLEARLHEAEADIHS